MNNKGTKNLTLDSTTYSEKTPQNTKPPLPPPPAIPMNNNKQSMKLYTEEQVRMLDINCGNSTLDEVIGCLTPIEIPSDEEIGKLRDEHIPIDEKDMWSERLYFTLGAKSIRDKIQGGNK